MNRNRTPIAERFWPKVDKTGDCWLWTANTNNAGYGLIWNPDEGKKVYAHRTAYIMLRGPIPTGMSLDHLCHTTRCVNPDHLEPVTHRENILRSDAPPAVNARKNECPAGHPYDDFNTYTKPGSGARECRTCMARRAKEMESCRQRILSAAAQALGISVASYRELHGKSMRKALSLTGAAKEQAEQENKQ